jgi:hypothetical protein
MAKKPSNPFDAIAKVGGTAKKAASVKIAATVTDEIKQTVDKFIRQKGLIDTLEADQKDLAKAIRAHVQPQKTANARKGDWAKVYTLLGTAGAVEVTSTNKWTLPKTDEEIAQLEEVDPDFYEARLVFGRTIKMKDAAASNDELIGKILKACEALGLTIQDVFEVTDTLKIKEGVDLDKDQYELPDGKLARFRSIAKQAEPGVK